MNNSPFRYDIEGLADDMEIDLASISTLYSEYFHEMKANLQESRILFNDKEWEKLERVIHNIKGISVSLNILDIYLLANKLDIELKNNKIDDIQLSVNDISDLFDAAESDIKRFFSEKGINL